MLGTVRGNSARDKLLSQMKTARSVRLAALLGSRTRTARLWNHLMARLRREDGYLAFGYDLPTLRIEKPGMAALLLDVAAAHNSLPKN